MSIINHTKTDNIRGLGQLKNFNKSGQLISTLARTFEVSTTKEEDRRRRRGRGDIAKDGAEPEGGVVHAASRPAATPAF
jgi:hypothetical protein